MIFGGDELRCIGVQGSDVKAIALGIGGAAPIYEIEEMSAIGKEERPMMRFTAPQGNFGHRLGGTASGGDPVKRTREARSEHDDAVSIPSTTEAR